MLPPFIRRGGLMVYSAVGAEWISRTSESGRVFDPAAVRLFDEALALPPDRMRALAREERELLLPDRGYVLRSVRAEVLAGSRAVRAAGEILVALSLPDSKEAADGHFLIGLALRLVSDQGRRHFLLARDTYDDLGERLPARLAELAAAAAFEPDQLEKGAVPDLLSRALRGVDEVDPGCARRLDEPVARHARIISMTHGLITGGLVPTTTFTASEDELGILSFALVEAVEEPQRVLELVNWLRTLGIGAYDIVDRLVSSLGSLRLWEPRLVLLRDMLDRGDDRDQTLIEMAWTLTQLQQWPTAQALVLDTLEQRTRPASVELLRAMVMLADTVRAPEAGQWADRLVRAGGELPELAYLSSEMIEAEERATQAPELELRVLLRDGTMTIDPSIDPRTIKEQMLAATILSLDPEQARQMRDEVAAKDPETFAKVRRYLPAGLRPESPAEMHFATAENLFAQRRFREAITEYKAVIDLEPDHQVAHLWLGDAHFMLGEYAIAAAYFEESIAIRPTPQAYRFLGDAIVRGQGDLHLARRHYEQALALDPAYGGASEALQQVNEALSNPDRGW